MFILTIDPFEIVGPRFLLYNTVPFCPGFAISLKLIVSKVFERSGGHLQREG